MDNKHMLWMILTCVVPLLLIWTGTAYFGWKNNGLLTFVLVAAMIGGHLFMMKRRSGKGEKHH